MYGVEEKANSKSFKVSPFNINTTYREAHLSLRHNLGGTCWSDYYSKQITNCKQS